MNKNLKERSESKAAGREALDAGQLERKAAVVDTTVGHVEGPAGTWNTSGVELPTDLSAVRDVRVETRDAVSLDDLKTIGVPVRAAEDRAELIAEAAAADAATVEEEAGVRVYDDILYGSDAEAPAKGAKDEKKSK
jgi:hypothetical protein